MGRPPAVPPDLGRPPAVPPDLDDNPANPIDHPNDNPHDGAVPPILSPAELFDANVDSKVSESLLFLGVEDRTAAKVKFMHDLIKCREIMRNCPTKLKKEIVQQRFGVKKHGDKSSIARAIELCRNSVYPKKSAKKITSRRRMAESKVKAVDEFLRRPDNCYTLPDKKHYRKDGGMFIPVVALVDCLRNLHRKFVTETGLTMSFSTFCKARDRRTIKCSVFLKRSVCLCKPHANMKLMLEVVPGLSNSTRELVELSDADLKAGLDSIKDNQSVKYKAWTKNPVKFVKGDQPERTVYHTELEKKCTTGESFKKLFEKEMPEFREHCRRVNEQYEAVRLLKSTLPSDHAICHMDYAENWPTSFFEEIQSAFFGKDQITLHPMVVYTKLQEILDHKCYVGVTEVTDHKFPSTLAFLMELIEHIKLSVPDLKHLHLVTDSPSSQYRNRFACDMLVRAAEQFGIRITWNWLEAGHGKGPCDGVGGALKGLADRVVKQSGAIQSATDFVEQLRPATDKVTLLQCTRQQIKVCERVVEDWLSRPVEGILSYHQATFVDDQLYLRPTSCYKECCFSHDGDLVPSAECDGWKRAKFGHRPKPTVPRTKKKPKDKATTPVQAEQGDVVEAEPHLEAQPDPTPKPKAKPKAKSRRKREATPETSDADDSDSEYEHCEQPEDVTPRTLRKRGPVQAVYADSDPDSEVEDGIRGNEAGLEEGLFSSDEELGEAADRIHLRTRVRAHRRRTETINQLRLRNAGGEKEAATATVSGAACSAGDVNEPDREHGQETPKERARTEKLNAKAKNQASRRRKGELVNECLEDQGDSTDEEEWPVMWEMSVAEYLRRYGDSA